jgi:transposase InsO family protein
VPVRHLDDARVRAPQDCYDKAVMESFFSTLKSEPAERFESCGTAKMELFDYIEVFYNHRHQHPTLGQIRKSQETRGVDSGTFGGKSSRGLLACAYRGSDAHELSLS